MTRQGAVLGTRQLQPDLQFAQAYGKRESSKNIENRGVDSGFPCGEELGRELYCSRMTVR
jgi:hypothetical protein